MTQLSNKKMDLILKTQENECSELRSFFMSISRTVENFCPYDRAIIKKKILDLVTDTEIEKLRMESNIPTNVYNANWGTNAYSHVNHSSLVSSQPSDSHQMPLTQKSSIEYQM